MEGSVCIGYGRMLYFSFFSCEYKRKSGSAVLRCLFREMLCTGTDFLAMPCGLSFRFAGIERSAHMTGKKICLERFIHCHTCFVRRFRLLIIS